MIPPYLASTVALLQRAFPAGIGEAEYLYVLRALYEHMSDRNLAHVIGLLRGDDYALFLNDVYRAAQLPEAGADYERVLARLREVGFAEWVAEE